MGRRSRSAEKRPTNHQRAEGRIVEALIAAPGAKTADLSSQLKVDQETIRGVLVALEEAGRARREGRTRGTRWYLTGLHPATDAPSGQGGPEPRKPARTARKAQAPGDGGEGASYGWRVTLVVKGAETDRIVVSDSLASAAAAAAQGARALGGEITGIVRIGRALQRPPG
jgi:hypothetical protein